MTDEKEKGKKPTKSAPSRICDVQLGTTTVRDEEDEDES